MLARSSLDDVATAKVVFVAYGPGIDFLLEGAKDHGDDPYDYAVLNLSERGVELRVCAATLAARDIAKADLIEVVRVVPSGISEIVRLQFKEALMYSALPGAQGRAAIFDGCKPLKMAASESRASRMAS